VATRGEPASLLGITVWRSFNTGRLYLVIGLVVSAFWAGILGATDSPTFDTIVPLLIPVLANTGTMGGMLVFTNDRVKGVLEYLLAYGVSPRRIFMNVLVASFVQVSIVTTLAIGAGVTVHFASGYGVDATFVRATLTYSVPMNFAVAAFVSTAGMFWTSLSTPRSGMNSPLGLLPLLGIAPPGLVLILTEALPGYYFVLTSGAAVVIAVAAIALIRNLDRLLPRERLLSPA